MSDRIGGVISFVAGNVAYEIEGSMTIQPHRFQRTSAQGLMGPAGHSREPSQPSIEGTFFYKAGVSLSVLRSLVNTACQVDLYNGAKFVLSQAAQVGEIELDAAAGTFPLRLEGNYCQEISPPTS